MSNFFSKKKYCCALKISDLCFFYESTNFKICDVVVDITALIIYLESWAVVLK